MLLSSLKQTIVGSFAYMWSKADSDHLCYINWASFTTSADLSPESRYLVPLVLSFKLVPKTCTKVIPLIELYCKMEALSKIKPFFSLLLQPRSHQTVRVSNWLLFTYFSTSTNFGYLQPWRMYRDGELICPPPPGPFHKSFHAGVKTLAGLRSTLGVKSNPAKGEMNVWFSFTKEIHAGVEARRHGFDWFFCEHYTPAWN